MVYKEECNGCGADDYEGALKECPFCLETKCEYCDMGDDVFCISCEGEED